MTATFCTLKQQAHEIIDRLPDTATWDDVAYALSIQDIEAGLADSDADRVVATKTLRALFGLPAE